MSNAIRYAAGAGRSTLGTVYLQCYVKPGASKVREGVLAVTDEAVELCVAAPARDGEANAAVVSLLSKVLRLPKSRLQITRGAKSREKTVAIAGMTEKSETEEALLARVREALEKAVGGD